MARLNAAALPLCVALLALCLAGQSAAGRYYSDKVQDKVRKEVEKAMAYNPSVGPALVRLVFHDCWVNVSTTATATYRLLHHHSDHQLMRQKWLASLSIYRVVMDPCSWTRRPPTAPTPRRRPSTTSASPASRSSTPSRRTSRPRAPASCRAPTSSRSPRATALLLYVAVRQQHE